ncbi:MAG TPA: radical SAM protein [Accumulibacter sp.]|nr:radical SAM protein [Accumulibacter sp.]
MNSFFKYLYHRCVDGESRWYPLLAIYYLTYRCTFRCPYCSNGANQPYHRLPVKAVDAATALEILRRIRRHSEHLVITGGEPLEHADVGEVLRRLPALKFKTVAFTTNGHDLDRHLPEIAAAIDTLVVSLDTLEVRKADAWFGQGDGALTKILTNIEAAAAYRHRRYEIVISAVATPNNIPDLHAVHRYAQERGFQLAVCPELQGVKAPERLRHHPDYKAFFNFLVDEKKRGQAIFGSTLYLEHMRDFRAFRCHPFAMLAVDPRGEIFFPCLEIGQMAGNILDHDDLHAVRRAAHKNRVLPAGFGTDNDTGSPNSGTDCRASCHSACALGFSLAIEHPWSAAADTLRSRI